MLVEVTENSCLSDCPKLTIARTVAPTSLKRITIIDKFQVNFYIITD